MLYSEIIAVCSEIQTQHVITLCGQYVELLNFKPGGTCSYHWYLKGQRQLFRKMSKTYPWIGQWSLPSTSLPIHLVAVQSDLMRAARNSKERLSSLTQVVPVATATPDVTAFCCKISSRINYAWASGIVETHWLTSLNRSTTTFCWSLLIFNQNKGRDTDTSATCSIGGTTLTARRRIFFPVYTGCPRRNVKYFGRVFLMLNYTDITQNT
jgi:hypothetical protein